MGSRPEWTPEEELYLTLNWGKEDYFTLSVNLGRSESAIDLRAQRLGLGASKDAQGFLNTHQLSKAMGIDLHTVTDYWIPKCGLKVTRKVTRHTFEFRLIDLKDFWEWAELNQDKFDSRRFAPMTLGPEPDWMAGKRAADTLLPARRSQLWTDEEDEQLLSLLDTGLKYKAIGAIMGRSNESIERRTARLRRKKVVSWLAMLGLIHLPRQAS